MQLRSICGAHVNVAYGDNTSGKSGWATLIKAVARARHREPVHADALSLRVARRHTIKTRRGELWVSRHEERVSPGIDRSAQARCERRNLVGLAPAFV